MYVKNNQSLYLDCFQVFHPSFVLCLFLSFNDVIGGGQLSFVNVTSPWVSCFSAFLEW